MNAKELAVIAEKVEKLNASLAEWGLELVIQPKKNKRYTSSTGPAQKKKNGATNHPLKKYWDTIKEISEKQGITKGEARALYNQRKGEAAPAVAAK